jgi:hypothetical protein
MAALIDAGRWRARLRGHLLAEGLCGPRYCGGRALLRSGGTAMRATPRSFLLFNTSHQTYPTRLFPPRLDREQGAEGCGSATAGRGRGADGVGAGTAGRATAGLGRGAEGCGGLAVRVAVAAPGVRVGLPYAILTAPVHRVATLRRSTLRRGGAGRVTPAKRRGRGAGRGGAPRRVRCCPRSSRWSA